MFQKDTLAIRVLAGTNVFFSGVGAIAEYVTRSEQKLEFAQAFETELRKVLDALEWDDVPIYKKIFSRGWKQITSYKSEGNTRVKEIDTRADDHLLDRAEVDMISNAISQATLRSDKRGVIIEVEEELND